MKLAELHKKSALSLRRGSKSFSFASLFLNARQKRGSALLYSFCRFVDDSIDLASSREEAVMALRQIRLWVTTTHNVTQQGGDLDSSFPVEMWSLRVLFEEYRLPLKYPLDLLEGMQMDVEGFRYETFAQLERYCYCVAGTVGLMMCHVLGVSSSEALPHAVALGKAMQMTNICRDVQEDLRMNRIYFPREWLAELSLDRQTFSANKEQWPRLVRRLLLIADEHYFRGRKGLRYLPWHGALAVGIASRVYQAIGDLVIAKGSAAWEQRTFTSPATKIRLAFSESMRFLFASVRRLLRPWKAKPITQVWEES